MWNIIEFLLDLEKEKNLGYKFGSVRSWLSGFALFLIKKLKILIMSGQIHI